jgi:hypothetical protein
VEKDIKHSRRVFVGQSRITNGVQAGTGSGQLRALEGVGIELRTSCKPVVAQHYNLDAGNRHLPMS